MDFGVMDFGVRGFGALVVSTVTGTIPATESTGIGVTDTVVTTLFGIMSTDEDSPCVTEPTAVTTGLGTLPTRVVPTPTEGAIPRREATLAPTALPDLTGATASRPEEGPIGDVTPVFGD